MAEAVRKPGGSAALRMRIVEQFIEELGKILGSAQVSVVPSQLANIRGFFEGMSQVSAKMSEPQRKTRRAPRPGASGQPEPATEERDAENPYVE